MSWALGLGAAIRRDPEGQPSGPEDAPLAVSGGLAVSPQGGALGPLSDRDTRSVCVPLSLSWTSQCADVFTP